MATWDVQGDYGYGHGWEHVDSADSESAAYKAMAVYRENQPGVPFRVVLDRSDESFDYGAAQAALRQAGS
jgi:hypothetical protein